LPGADLFGADGVGPSVRSLVLFHVVLIAGITIIGPKAIGDFVRPCVLLAAGSEGIADSCLRLPCDRS
jgi:hypothetical protein